MSRERLPTPWAEGGPTSDDAEARAAELVRRALAAAEAEAEAELGADVAAAARVRVGLERELLRRASTPPRNVVLQWGVGLGGAAAAAVLFAVWLPSRGATTGRVLEGTVLALEGGTPRPLPVGEVPAPGTRLGCADRCRIEVTSGIEAVLVAETVLSIAGPDRTEVHVGAAAFSVDPLPPGERFFVYTGVTKVEVIGTAFLVEAAGAGPARVSVTHGTVQVSHEGLVRYVHAGEAWVAPGAMSARGGGAVAPAPQPPAAPEASVAAPQPPKAAQPHAAAEPTSAQLIERAASLIGRGQLVEARAVYARLAELKGASGELGLYLLAQLELRQLAAPKDAERTLEQLRRRYPSGSLTLERDLTSIEVLVALGRCADARAGIANFRAEYSGSAAMLADVEAAMVEGGCGG